jgi:hypothetical protein
MITAAGSDTASAGRGLAVAIMLKADRGTARLAAVDVVASVAAAHGLEQAGAVAPIWTWNAKGRTRGVGAGIANEAVVLRVTGHGLVAASPMRNFMTAGVRVLERIAVPIGSADEALGRFGLDGARLATGRSERQEGTEDDESSGY